MSTVATIVCPVDFSDHSKVALARAGAWAQHFGARLIVVTVVEPLLVSAAATTYEMDLVRDEAVPELRDFVAKGFAAAGAGIAPPTSWSLWATPPPRSSRWRGASTHS
jgi:universal stress protein A